MESPEKISEKRRKKTNNESYANVLQQIPEIIQQNIQQTIQVVREEIQNTSNDVKLMIRGVHAEIQEVKTLATSNKRLIEDLARKTPLKKPTTEISSGLDLLEKIPQHLRRTYETIMKIDQAATARDVAEATGKSRPLESDYLNQLSDLGWIFRKRSGKTVLFYSKPEDIDEENNGLNPNATIDFIASKKNQVKEASASSEKN